MTARHRPGGRDFFRERNKLYRPPSVARRRLTGWHSLLEARVNQGRSRADLQRLSRFGVVPGTDRYPGIGWNVFAN
jgi:hypothetical protein